MVTVMMFGAVGVFAQELSISEIKQSLTFSVLTDQSITDVTENFILPVEYEGAFIVWESDNENAICIDGGEADLWARVIRPPFGEGYVRVNLTAYITKNGEMLQKSFLIRVKEKDIGFAYSETMMNAYKQFEMDFLSKQNVLALTNDIILPEPGSFDKITVSYKSDNTSVVNDEGKITRNFEKDMSANFTAYFTEGFETFKVTYPVIVSAYTDEEIKTTAQKDLEEVITELKKKYNLMALTGNIELPQTGKGGSTIFWSSSDNSVISNNGIKGNDAVGKSAVLTATAGFHGATAPAVQINVKVISTPTDINEIEGNPGIGSSGGGGGGSQSTPAQKDEENENKDVVFSDVPASHWGYEAISYLAKRGVVNGIADGVFAPDSFLTREQAVKIILLGLGIEVNEGVNESEFTDAVSGAWYVPYIKSAYNEGIVRGISESEFGVERQITRQELATIIYRAVQTAQLPLDGDMQISFADRGNISDWAQEGVSELSAAGIINGREGCFYPNDNATRAELCAMIARILD